MRVFWVILFVPVIALAQTYNVAITNSLLGPVNITATIDGAGIADTGAVKLVGSTMTGAITNESGFFGNGSGVTNISAANIAAGTVASAFDGSAITNITAATATNVLLLTGGDMEGGLTNTSAGGFVGNGVGLTNLTLTTYPIETLSNVDSAAAPTTDDVLKWNGAAWSNAAAAAGTTLSTTGAVSGALSLNAGSGIDITQTDVVFNVAVTNFPALEVRYNSTNWPAVVSTWNILRYNTLITDTHGGYNTNAYEYTIPDGWGGRDWFVKISYNDDGMAEGDRYYVGYRWYPNDHSTTTTVIRGYLRGAGSSSQIPEDIRTAFIMYNVPTGRIISGVVYPIGNNLDGMRDDSSTYLHMKALP